MPNEDHNQNDLNNELDEFQDEINENSEQYDAIEDIEISKEMRIPSWIIPCPLSSSVLYRMSGME